MKTFLFFDLQIYFAAIKAGMAMGKNGRNKNNTGRRILEVLVYELKEVEESVEGRRRKVKVWERVKKDVKKILTYDAEK